MRAGAVEATGEEAQRGRQSSEHDVQMLAEQVAAVGDLDAFAPILLDELVDVGDVGRLVVDVTVEVEVRKGSARGDGGAEGDTAERAAGPSALHTGEGRDGGLQLPSASVDCGGRCGEALRVVARP